MTLQDLGSIGEFVAAIATLATLIYLALQIRQNTRKSQAASRNLVSQSFVDFCNHVSSDMEITKLTRRGDEALMAEAAQRGHKALRSD